MVLASLHIQPRFCKFDTNNMHPPHLSYDVRMSVPSRSRKYIRVKGNTIVSDSPKTTHHTDIVFSNKYKRLHCQREFHSTHLRNAKLLDMMNQNNSQVYTCFHVLLVVVGVPLLSSLGGGCGGGLFSTISLLLRILLMCCMK